MLSDFWYARRDAPMWLSAGLTDNGAALGAEILKADDWGLEAKDFELPAGPAGFAARGRRREDRQGRRRDLAGAAQVRPPCARRPHHRAVDPAHT